MRSYFQFTRLRLLPWTTNNSGSCELRTTIKEKHRERMREKRKKDKRTKKEGRDTRINKEIKKVPFF